MAIDERHGNARKRNAEVEGECARSALRAKMASATACGAGSRRELAKCDAANQAASSSASETSRRTKFNRSVPPCRRCPDQAPAPGRRGRRRRHRPAHRYSALRIGKFVGNGPARNALAIALAIDRPVRAPRSDADARREPLPFGVRAREDVLGFARGGEETGEQCVVMLPPSRRRKT